MGMNGGIGGEGLLLLLLFLLFFCCAAIIEACKAACCAMNAAKARNACDSGNCVMILLVEIFLVLLTGCIKTKAQLPPLISLISPVCGGTVKAL